MIKNRLHSALRKAQASMEFLMTYGWAILVVNPNEPTHNNWHRVVFTKNTNGSAYYIDGYLINSSTYADPARTPASDIIIADTAVDTDIDNLKIYNRALSSNEI